MILRLLIALFLIVVVSATIYSGAKDKNEAGLKPGNPLYVFDSLIEKIDLWGTKDKEEKIKKLTGLIEEKLNEAAELLGQGDDELAQQSLAAGDDYIKDALDFINTLKSKKASDGASADAEAPGSASAQKIEQLTQDLGEAVLKKQEILADAYKNAPASTKGFIEETIKDSQEEIKKVVEDLDAESNEKLTSDIEQTQELVDDKIEEAKEEEIKKELEDLSNQEKKYNIWIDHFYAEDEDGMTAVSAHIRRRDPQCRPFKGKFNLYVNNTFYRSFDLSANGYEDVRKTFDKFFLEKGTYWMTGVLVDGQGSKISNKQFKLII
ncbi:hypothetical protein KJ885_01805 [Patescibacteria group bacterium]|nr:hypothetical protein [Patescibacteria group bacterium]